MIYKRKTHQVHPDKISLFNKIFHEYILPSHVKNGARLTGRWVTKDNREICEIWEYPSHEAYKEIQKRVKKDKLFQSAYTLIQDLKSVGYTYTEDELEITGSYSSPKHTVTVSGFITDSEGKVLLVKTYWRKDTWELPGGAVDEGETLDEALHREIFEETGVQVNLLGISGIYSNGSVVSIVFTGTFAGGEPRPSAETHLVEFKHIDKSNFETYITRPKFKPRVLHAMEGHCIPYEAFKIRPYELLKRYTPENFGNPESGQ